MYETAWRKEWIEGNNWLALREQPVRTFLIPLVAHVGIFYCPFDYFT